MPSEPIDMDADDGAIRPGVVAAQELGGCPTPLPVSLWSPLWLTRRLPQLPLRRLSWSHRGEEWAHAGSLAAWVQTACHRCTSHTAEARLGGHDEVELCI